MAHCFKNIDSNTPMLLPPDLRDWVAEDDLVHFVIGAVERLPLSAFAVNHKACGDEQFPSQMMLGLLIDSSANGIFGSRRIERATYRDVGSPARRFPCYGGCQVRRVIPPPPALAPPASKASQASRVSATTALAKTLGLRRTSS